MSDLDRKLMDIAFRALEPNPNRERHGIACNCPECVLRERLRHEQQDEPREPCYSNIEPNTGLRRYGEI